MTHIHQPPHFAANLSRPRHRLAILLWLLVGLMETGCSANTPQQGLAEKTQPYYQDAQLCRAKSPDKALPAGEDPAAHLDEAAYLLCMKKAGYQQDAKTDPLISALRRCRQEGTRSVSASGEQKHVSPTPATVRSCLRSRGFPSRGEPPATAKLPLTSERDQSTSSRTEPSATKEPVQTVIIPKRLPGSP